MKTAATTLALALALVFTGGHAVPQSSFDKPPADWLAMRALDAQPADERPDDDYRHNWEADWNDAH